MLRFMLRIPGFAADLLAGALIYRVLRARCSFNAAILAAAAYVFNPALIFDSAYWGQTAAIHSLFMLLSIIALDRHRYDWAGVALAAAILTKPQAIAIAPLVLMLAIKERGTLRLVAGGVVATLVIMLMPDPPPPGGVLPPPAPGSLAELPPLAPGSAFCVAPELPT